MILFKNIEYKNILSVGNLSQKINLIKESQTLMVGGNGSGKSTILDALIFVLYGKAFRKIRLDQLINSINTKGLLVTLEFSIGNTDYKIIRGLKPNIFEIYVNGVLREMDAAKKDYQNHLENNILKMTLTTFKQIVILGSTSYVPFMRLSREERRSIIGDLLDIQVFTYMNQVIKQREKILDAEYVEIQSTVRSLISQTDIIKEHISDVTKQSKVNKKQYEKKINAALSVIDETEEKIQDLLSSIIDIEIEPDTNNKLSNKIQKLKTLKTTIQTNNASHKKTYTFFKKNESCPTCEQDISDELKCDKLSFHEKKIKEFDAGVYKIVNEIEVATKELNNILNIARNIKSMQSDINTHKHTINNQQENIDNYESDMKENKVTVDISKDKKNLKLLDNELSESKIIRDELSTDGQYYSAIVDMLKDSGIKTAIIKSYLPVINKLVRKYLDVLDFNVDFRFDEEFNEIIKSRYRDNFSYANFSEGEKMRIDLSLLFVWRELARMRNSAATNLLILDEIGDSSLDDDGFESFMKIISETSQQQNTFIISHKVDIMIDKFNNVYQFRKVDNFSQLT